jgi:AraC family transcriptional regulator, regulatory protein of adaptative response / methylated-DNA-[protein]-cysteine methyltransferase
LRHKIHTIRESRKGTPTRIDFSVVEKRPDFHIRPGARPSDKRPRKFHICKTDRSADMAWHAILIRDRRSDGKFVYAVNSTGLYCRPSCPARHPLRRNVLLYGTAEEAESNGYLACSRCSPGARSETLAETCVRTVIKHIETHILQTVTVKALSEATNLSASHLQHAFKRITGLTPKRYHDSMRIDHFKACLKRGESIVRAAYGSGYGSSRALYESAGKNMGMTPSVYQRGSDILIRFAFVASSSGPVLVAGTRRGPCALLRGSNPRMLFQELCLEFPKAEFAREAMPPGKWIAAVRSGDAEDPFVMRLPSAIRDRIFRARVSSALRKMVPVGRVSETTDL